MTSIAERTDDETPTPPQERLTPLQAVLARLRECSGFPTLSTTISDINHSVASDSYGSRQLTQVILRDVALTTKLLQVVNSAVYGQYHGRIRTVSKAVLILGFEAVRDIAMSLMMLEFPRGRSQEKALQDELVGAFFAGVLSKPLCRRLGIDNSEEAVICTMFHSLGRLLVISFLYEESREVRALMDTGMSEEHATEQVLGISYAEIGIGVARHWNFPERLLHGMQRIEPREIARPKTDVEKLKIAANFANDLYLTALRSSQAEKLSALQALSARYSPALKLEAKELLAAIEQGLKDINDRATTLNLPVAHSPTLNVIHLFRFGTTGNGDSAAADASSDDLLRDVDALDTLASTAIIAFDPHQMLSAGIRDVTEALTSDVALNDVLQMVLETIYRGMRFTRTMIFVRDPRMNAMRARLGFGADIERIIPKCSFTLAFAPDVFHVALEKGVDVAIENTQAGNIIERIPEWHKQLIDARSFLLLPVMLKGHAIGLLYADREGAEALKISPEQLGLLRTLRSQVVLAFKHCAASNPS